MAQGREQLCEEGYAVLPVALPAPLLDRHAEAVESLLADFDCEHNVGLQHPSRERERELRERLDRLEYGHEEGAMPLAFTPEIQDRICELFGVEPVLTSARTTLWEAGDRAAHFDTSMLSTTPHTGVYRTWCALDDIDPSCGTFYVYPGTHVSLPDEVCREALKRPGVAESLQALVEAYDRCGRRMDATTCEPAWKQFHGLAWPVICELVAEKTKHLERKAFPLRKGEVLVFSPRVVHGTMPRTDPSLPRKCQISEWRASTARMFFAAESFGPTHDLRGRPGAGRLASEGAVRTPWGLLGARD